MKALTLTQPWATLVSIDAKRFETRGWSTNYRGPLAIHAGKGLNPVGGKRGLRALCGQEPFRAVLADADYADPEDLPRGIIVATVNLVGCYPTLGPELGCHVGVSEAPEAAPHEADFGDYTAGRFAWGLTDVRLDFSDPVRGALGLWEAPCMSKNPHAAAICEKPNGHDGEHQAGDDTWNWGDS